MMSSSGTLIIRLKQRNPREAGPCSQAFKVFLARMMVRGWSPDRSKALPSPRKQGADALHFLSRAALTGRRSGDDVLGAGYRTGRTHSYGVDKRVFGTGQDQGIPTGSDCTCELSQGHRQAGGLSGRSTHNRLAGRELAAVTELSRSAVCLGFPHSGIGILCSMPELQASHSLD